MGDGEGGVETCEAREENASLSIFLDDLGGDAAAACAVAPQPCALWVGVGRNLELLVAEAVGAQLRGEGGGEAVEPGGRLPRAIGLTCVLLLRAATRALAEGGCGCGPPPPPPPSRGWACPVEAAERAAEAEANAEVLRAAAEAAAALERQAFPHLLRLLGGSHSALVLFLRQLPSLSCAELLTLSS